MDKFHTDAETHKMLVNLINGFLDKDDLVRNDLEDCLDYETNALSALLVATTLLLDLVPPHIYTHDIMGEVIFV